MNSLPFAISLHKTSDLLKTIKGEFGFSPAEVIRAKKLLGSGLPPLVRPEIMSYLFGVSYRLLLSMPRVPDRYYRIYRIPKTGGGYRQIEAPRRFLKLMQRWIYDYILSQISISPYKLSGFK